MEVTGVVFKIQTYRRDNVARVVVDIPREYAPDNAITWHYEDVIVKKDGDLVKEDAVANIFKVETIQETDIRLSIDFHIDDAPDNLIKWHDQSLTLVFTEEELSSSDSIGKALIKSSGF